MSEGRLTERSLLICAPVLETLSNAREQLRSYLALRRLGLFIMARSSADFRGNTPYDNPDVLANAFRVYHDNYMLDREFMTGWRLWSVESTQHGTATEDVVKFGDKSLISMLVEEGRAKNSFRREEWTQFRDDVYRSVKGLPGVNCSDPFKHVSFVFVDSCFTINFKMNSPSVHELLRKMFVATDTRDVPDYFIILDNLIGEVEAAHKLQQERRYQYQDTVDGVKAYKNYDPSLEHDGITRMRLPFHFAHHALTKSEANARVAAQQNREKRSNWDPHFKKLETYKALTLSRAMINDYAYLFMIRHLRKCFDYKARAAILTDDKYLIDRAGKFIVPVSGQDKGLPSDYLDHFIVGPSQLKKSDWEEWRKNNLRRSPTN